MFRLIRARYARENRDANPSGTVGGFRTNAVTIRAARLTDSTHAVSVVVVNAADQPSARSVDLRQRDRATAFYGASARQRRARPRMIHHASNNDPLPASMGMTALRTLVAYFSVSGHTKAAAAAIAEPLGADLERIEAVKPLPGSRQALLFLGGFAASMKFAWAARPASRKPGDYDLVIIGTPIWAWKLNPVVRGWLRANPLPANVPYAAFATAGGVVGSQAFDDMAAMLGRAPRATTTICDADRKSGGDKRLIERFVADVQGRTPG